MVVDYVHVSAQGTGGGGTGAITGFGGKCVDVAGANSTNEVNTITAALGGGAGGSHPLASSTIRSRR